MKTILEDICDIISTIMPDEEEIKIYEERSNNLSYTDILLDLLVSNLIFKMLAVRNASDDSEYDAPGSNPLINSLKLFCKNENLLTEWKDFSLFHVHYIAENYPLNPTVHKYLLHELKLHEKTDITEQELWERDDNEELVYDYTNFIISNLKTINQEELNSLRYLFEGKILLNCHILEEEKNTELIQEHLKEYQNELSLKNY